MNTTHTDSDSSYKSRPNNSDFGDMAGETGLPFVGVALDMVKDILAFSRRRHERYGNVSRIQLGTERGLYVLGPDNFQKVLLDSQEVFSAQMGYKPLAQVYPGGLLVRDFADHRKQRRILQSAFKTEAMAGYVSTVSDVLESHLAELDTETSFTFYAFIKRALLAVGARVFVGLEEESAETERLNSAFIRINGALGSIVRLDIPGTAFHRGLRSRDWLYDFLASLVPARRSGNGSDMMSRMCREEDENGQPYPELDIVQHTAFLLFAAHDTTTSALTHLMMYLGREPEWQDRLAQECLSLGKDDISYGDLGAFPNIDNAFRECLRLHPSVPLLARRTTRDIELEEFVIPAHTVMWLPTNFNHYDGTYWTQPGKFDPDRFAPGREEHKGHSFCYHPYGGGAHKCIGMHFAPLLAKVFLFHLLRNYVVQTPPGYDPKLLSIPLPKPADGVPITLKPR